MLAIGKHCYIFIFHIVNEWNVRSGQSEIDKLIHTRRKPRGNRDSECPKYPVAAPLSIDYYFFNLSSVSCDMNFNLYHTKSIRN